MTKKVVMQVTVADRDEREAAVTLLTVTVPEKLAAAAGIRSDVRVAQVSDERSGNRADKDIQGAVDAVDALLRIRFGTRG